MKPERKRGEDKLYKQWVKRGDLPPEAVPQKESPKDTPVTREKSGRGRLTLYVALGVGILLLLIGLVLILTQ